MKFMGFSIMHVAGAAMVLLGMCWMAGCGVEAVPAGPVAGAVLSGRAMGGQQPINGMTIQLYEVSTSGYGTASTALISATVQTDVNGNFSITHDYTCPTPSTLVYLTGTGGNPGLTAPNTAIAEMALLGQCGNLTSSTFIIMNEVTTIAAVYALAPFMTAIDHVGTSATNVVGLTNAFGTAANLANFSTGGSPGQNVPTGAVIPSGEINTLANALASCVNSAGGTAGDGSNCGNLFSYTTVNGVVPTDTVGAAMSIAQNPGNNVYEIKSLTSSSGPFQPGATNVLYDLSIAVTYPFPSSPNMLAFDAAGNVWATTYQTAMYEMSPTGTLLGTYPMMGGNAIALDPNGVIWVGTQSYMKQVTTASPGATPGSVTLPIDVFTMVVDGAGNAWYAGGGSSLYEMSPGMSVIATKTLGENETFNMAMDNSNNVWSPNGTGSVAEFANGGSPVGGAPWTCCSGGSPYAISTDSHGSAWIEAGSALSVVSPTGVDTDIWLSSSGTNPGGIYRPDYVLVDGVGNVWVLNNESIGYAAAGSLSEYTPNLTNGGTGTWVSPPLGYISSTLGSPYQMDIDASGNLWVRNSSNANATVFVGLAAPVVRPLSLAAKNGTLGTRP